MDLYFQGRAWFNKGRPPEHMAQARGFFERALALDPKNIEALVGMAQVELSSGGGFLTDDRAARFAAAETNVIKALSLAPDHASAHLVLGLFHIFTNRAAQGIAECEQALALNRNLAARSCAIGFAKFFMGRGAETEGHILEAFRLSPRDIFAHQWMQVVGVAKLHLAQMPKPSVGYDEASRPTAISRSHISSSLPRLALLGSLDEARTAAQAGLALVRASPSAVSAPPPNRATMRLTLLGSSASAWACAWPGCRRGNARYKVLRPCSMPVSNE